MRKKLLSAAIGACLLCFPATLVWSADAPLPRRSFLGVGGQPVDNGVAVTQLAESGTAPAAGVVVGDIILSVNGDPVRNFPDLISASNNMNEGDAASIEILRDGATLILSATAEGRPRELAPNIDVIYDEVTFGNERLRSIIYKPVNIDQAPAVYFLQGYTCSQIDFGPAPWHAIRKFVTAFANAGYVVYRLERPGLGDSRGELNCADIDYPTEYGAFSAGFEALLQYPFVDRENVFLFGHSLGGVTAPLLSQEHQTRGIITYGSVAKPWYEYILDVYRNQNLRVGQPPNDVERATRDATAFYYDLMVAKRDWSDIVVDHVEAIENSVAPISGERLFNRHNRFWATLNDVDLTKAWADFDGAALAIYGSYDIQAISSEAAEMTAQIVNAYPPGGGRALIIPEAEHQLARYPGTFKEYAAAVANGEWNARAVGENFDQRIADQSISWINDVLASQ